MERSHRQNSLLAGVGVRTLGPLFEEETNDDDERLSARPRPTRRRRYRDHTGAGSSCYGSGMSQGKNLIAAARRARDLEQQAERDYTAAEAAARTAHQCFGTARDVRISAETDLLVFTGRADVRPSFTSELQAMVDRALAPYRARLTAAAD